MSPPDRGHELSTPEQKAALANVRELGDAAGPELRNLVASGLYAQWAASLDYESELSAWKRMAEERAFMIDHLKRHIHQLRTGQVPMPNGQYVANPMRHDDPPNRGLADLRAMVETVEVKCGHFWGPSDCAFPGHPDYCKCVLGWGHDAACICACGTSPR